MRVALAVALAGCATVPPPAPAALRADPSFEAQGRLSARRGAEGIAVHYTWRHTPATDEFDVATPLGDTVARMRGDRRRVLVTRAKEGVAEYPDWGALTQAVLGVPIPVEGLAYWIQASPAPSSAHDMERDAAGRPLVLRQQGWEIVYAWGADGARPTRLVMRYPDSEPIEVRIVIDRWGDG
jgi:outer membrane lipoprotein LolB